MGNAGGGTNAPPAYLQFDPVDTVAGSMEQNGIAVVNGAQIAYDVAGSGPPVLLLHAGIGDRRMWDSQVPAFAEHFTVIRFDARGFGETLKPDAPFSSYADAIALLDHLD